MLLPTRSEVAESLEEVCHYWILGLCLDVRAQRSDPMNVFEDIKSNPISIKFCWAALDGDSWYEPFLSQRAKELSCSSHRRRITYLPAVLQLMGISHREAMRMAMSNGRRDPDEVLPVWLFQITDHLLRRSWL